MYSLQYQIHMFYYIIIDSISPHLVHETLKMTRSMVKTHSLYKKRFQIAIFEPQCIPEAASLIKFIETDA